MKPGMLYGIHAEGSSQAVPLMRKYQAAGVQVAAILAHENPGLCVDAKRINPNILTIARWGNPVSRWEGGQDVFSWSAAERLDFARKAIQMIFDRTNDEEYQASDYFTPGLNEWDPPEHNGDGYRAEAEVLKLLCQEATNRSAELVARGLHPIRLAIPGFNRGTPEYVEMKAMVATGLFDVMKARGDILSVHEGVGVNEAITNGFGDLIPGAPAVPPNAGSLCGRINYLYSLGVQVPYVVTEWYDGMWRTTPPAERLKAMQWYDRQIARRNPWCRGFCPFELTDIVDGPWWLWDFTPPFKSDAMLADMIAEKDKPNPIVNDEGDYDMDDATKKAIREHAVQIIALVDGKWWETKTPPYKLAATGKTVALYNADGTRRTAAPTQRALPAAGALPSTLWDVFERNGDLLKVYDPVGTANDWWVKAADVAPA